MTIDYSIVIPAYNEVAGLPKTITAIKAAMNKNTLNGEIVVCNSNSTDATGELAEAFGAKVVFEPYNQISRARNTGARHARGKYLIFIDADTIINDKLLSEVLQRLQSGQVCGGGAMIEVNECLTPALCSLFKLWTWVSVEFRLAAGCFFFCRYEDFKTVGGFSESVYAGEEIRLSRALYLLGREKRLSFDIITEYPVLTSGRKLTWFSAPKRIALAVVLIIFPFFTRYKRFCGFCYSQPENKIKKIRVTP